MKTLREFHPTSFDHSPANFAATSYVRDWLVAPCGNNRDADCLTESNWGAQHKALEKFSHDDWETLSFGHWACGWYEVVVVKPGTKAAEVCAQLEERLQDYPALDEDDWGIREREAAWENWTCHDVQQILEESETNARPYVSGPCAHAVLEVLCERGGVEQVGEYYQSTITDRDQVAAVLRCIRAFNRTNKADKADKFNGGAR